MSPQMSQNFRRIFVRMDLFLFFFNSIFCAEHVMDAWTEQLVTSLKLYSKGDHEAFYHFDFCPRMDFSSNDANDHHKETDLSRP